MQVSMTQRQVELLQEAFDCWLYEEDYNEDGTCKDEELESVRLLLKQAGE